MQQATTERSRSERLQIILALISLAGALLGTVIGNWDKLFPHPAIASISQPPAASAAPVTGSLAEAADLGAAQRRVLGDSTAALNSIAEQIEAGGQVAAAVPDIAGVWHDGDGNEFVFTQQGADYSYVHDAQGTRMSSGRGRLTGRDFRHSFAAHDGSGVCIGSVSADGRQASGECRSGGSAWPFSVVR